MMWARVVEIMLGVWLAMSPFIFDLAAEQRILWWTNFGCAGAIWVASFLSFLPRWNKLHLLHALPAGWMIGVAFWVENPPPPAPYQNLVVVGLLLLMFAIIPSRCDEPPRPWREFYRRNST